MEIDMPEWFDQYVGQPIDWAMRPEFFGFANVWMIVVGLFFFVWLIGFSHKRKTDRKRREQQKIKDREATEGRERDDEPYGPFANRYIVQDDD